MLPIPANADPALRVSLKLLDADMTVVTPTIVGFRQDATKIYVRYRAALAALKVVEHIQSTQAGEGGTAAYDASNYTSSTEVDCSATRLQDVEVTFVAGSTYAVFLVPLGEDGAGATVTFNGVAATDYMACVGFVV